jgi:hypothetical protein
LKKIGRIRGFVSPRLGIRLEPGNGPDNLTIIGRNGERFLTFEEVTQRAGTAEQRAETAEQRAGTAEQRAGTAEQRAERYAAMLRERGIEPD